MQRGDNTTTGSPQADSRLYYKFIANIRFFANTERFPAHKTSDYEKNAAQLHLLQASISRGCLAPSHHSSNGAVSTNSQQIHFFA